MNEKYFYTTETYDRWSREIEFWTMNDDLDELKSLEEAKKMAELYANGKPGDEDYVRTTYGVYYEN
jgi:hypothetical protein